ncbi:unnamed protein product [Acanthoscelides obtectus]|uniref:Mos1 transposase HTH domain-containing protein n=1 Tax=Acanthoscelides obtectus TaxID=200917 RepID=A0A9P0JRX3_ACAOB|nr:unnamed protein product [Acanthoscelides obtectus]CAK1668197.1 Histone-lysine N-methyltransferase SETMAR [Acanthoscelides obtectus]
MELNREHFRAIIYYNFQRQLSQQECLAELLSVFRNEAPHQSTISRWYGEFRRGRVSLSDDPRVGAPKTAIEASLKISKTSIQKILHEELGVRKLEQKAARVNWCQKMLDCFNSGNSKNVNSIVSGDESWIYCEEKPTKVIRSRKMVATFVSKAGHIATFPLNEQRTVTADWYTTIYDASSHTAQKTRQYLSEENVELLDHPPYSPDLSPNDFFTFPKIKNRLLSQRFQSPEEAWNKCFEN